MMPDTVTLTIPADTAYVAMARSVAAAMAARADLPLDQLEDARLAVDEALTQAIGDAAPGSEVACSFAVHSTGLVVEVSAASASGQPPSTGTFSWIVMKALVDEVSADVQDGRLTLRLSLSRSFAVQA